MNKQNTMRLLENSKEITSFLELLVREPIKTEYEAEILSILPMGLEEARLNPITSDAFVSYIRQKTKCGINHAYDIIKSLHDDNKLEKIRMGKNVCYYKKAGWFD